MILRKYCFLQYTQLPFHLFQGFLSLCADSTDSMKKISLLFRESVESARWLGFLISYTVTLPLFDSVVWNYMFLCRYTTLKEKESTELPPECTPNIDG